MNLRIKCLWCLLPALLWAVAAAAQPAGDPSADPVEDPPLAEGVGGDTTTARRLLESPLGTGEVTIEVLHAGIGGGSTGMVRPGGWAGFQLRVSDANSKPRQLLIRLQTRDADGDRVWWTTEVAGQGLGKDIPTWVYAWLPFDLGRDTKLEFVAYEGLPGSGGGFREGLRLGATPYQLTADPVPESSALVGVVGGNLAGLDQYNASRFRGVNAAPGGHELTVVVGGMIPAGLPDRWIGYSEYEALVWTGSGANETPDRLGPAQAEAIREWVRRGGHLIVVLPSVYQQWLGGSAGVSPLSDILPAVRVQTLEGVDLEDYRELLNKDDAVKLPKNAIVRTFTPDNAGPFDAMPVFNNASGQAVVVRRLVGSGAVTLVGIDVTSKALQERKGALEAVVFWNRILGKRLQLPSQAELGRTVAPGATRPWSANREPSLPMDSMINETIGKTAKAAKGLLVAFVIFLAYWLLAGPVGFLFLKQKHRQQHAWVLFTAITAGFALLGWLSTNLLRMGRDVDRHLTLVDHVYGQSNQRLRSWIELTLPKYGEQRVSVAASKDGASFDWHNALAAWRSFNDISTVGSFPDARAYRVDARKPDSAEFPARATTRQLQLDVAGSVPSNWQMPRPLAAEGVETGKEIWIEEGTGERGWTLHGQLLHNLPGKLRNVHVVVVREQRNPRARAGALLFPADAWIGRLTGEWDPNVALDLDKAIPQSTGQRGADGATSVFNTLRGNASLGQNITGVGRIELERGLMASSLLSMLEPPDETATGSVPWCYRTSMHTWDLGRWFTQPCIMVIGLLGNAGEDGVECPVPLSLDSAGPEETRKRIKGITLVRWIYPMPARPPVIRAASRGADADVELPPAAGSPPASGALPKATPAR